MFCILKALESTIPKDQMATAYMYHDDPFLLPTRRQHYRTYALSYESGKKTAMWIHKEHGNLFPPNLSDPLIKVKLNHTYIYIYVYVIRSDRSNFIFYCIF